MEKRYIGIDIDARHVRVAIVVQDGEALIALGKREYAAPEEIPAALREMIGDTRLFGDRLAAAVPAVEGFVRRLTFPFADPRKIESTLRFELDAQVPVRIDEYTTDFQAPVPGPEGEFRVMAAAVRTEYIESFLRTFDGSDIPLHVLDLAPFALACGLRDRLEDGLLVHLAERETAIVLVTGGRVAGFRLLAPQSAETSSGIVRILLRESATLQREAGMHDLPFLLAGPGVSQGLIEELQAAGKKASVPSFFTEGHTVEAEFIPAVALALRAGASSREREFNFRRGRFALKNELTALKRDLIGVALVLFLVALTVAGASWINYTHKANRAETLNREMTKIFRQTFPGSQPLVNPAQQMQSKLRELQDQGRMIGAGEQRTPLLVMREISRSLPESATLDVRDLSYTPDSLRLDGVTTSFDAINQIARSLEQSPLFAEAQIADAKMSLDGTRVDFRLNLLYRGGKETAK